ncbi:MAG TPA: SDR family oxidoreductase [Acidimicrobiia bacterium]|jgi:thioester reductase-like protein
MTSRTALLTGATGFLGSSLALELLRADRERVYCVVRPRGDVTDRLHRAVRAAADAAGMDDGVEELLPRLVALAGDIATPGLGLAPEDRARLAEDLPDEMWHTAASLRYEDKHKSEIMATNVDGTAHMVETVAGLGIPVLNHISTAYVAGLRVGDVPEEPFDTTFEPNNWYEASKRLGEDIVLAQASRFERVRIMRPSIVVGNLSTYRSCSDSGYYGFLRGLERFCRLIERQEDGYLDRHRVRLFVEPHSSLNLVPIDVLVTEAIELADGADPGRFFHLTNPFPITIERARIGPETSIDRLRLDLVEDRALLGEYDALLDDALDFYRPYLRNDKRFIRARDNGTPPDAIRITEEDLASLSVVHFDQKREAVGARRSRAALDATGT